MQTTPDNNPSAASPTMSGFVSQMLFPASTTHLVLQHVNRLDTALPEEARLNKNISQKRLLEFRAGRYCAKQALLALGIEDFSVQIGADREPVWPHTIVGSISHCKDLAGAVAAHSDSCKSLGLDIEKIKSLRFDISRHVCTDSEKIWLNRQNDDVRELLLIVIFSIKESIYKALFQLARIHLGFQDCTVIPDLTSNSARVTFITDKYSQAKDCCLDQRFIITSEHVISGTTIS